MKAASNNSNQARCQPVRTPAPHPLGPVEQADAGVVLDQVLLGGPLADRALHAQLSLRVCSEGGMNATMMLHDNQTALMTPCISRQQFTHHKCSAPAGSGCAQGTGRLATESP